MGAGNRHEGAPLCSEALTIALRLGFREAYAYGLVVAASILHGAAALELIGAADHLLSEMGMVLAPYAASLRESVLRSATAPATRNESGPQLAAERAVAVAIEALGAFTRDGAPPSSA